jgi:hypothetical protein
MKVFEYKKADDDEDEKRVVQPGEMVRVRLNLMDADVWRPSAARIFDSASRLHDGMGHPAGYKPGFVFRPGDPNDPRPSGPSLTFRILFGFPHGLDHASLGNAREDPD